MIYAENILLCIAIPLAVSLMFIRGEARRFVAAFLLGMGMCLISAYISGFLNLIAGMGEDDTAIFISPIVEEIMKLFPLLFFLAVFEPRDRALTMIAVAIGAGFATFENCCYILTGGAESLPYIMIRGMAVGVMHIESILELSVWMVLAKRLKAFSFPAVMGGLALSMTYHAIYNLLVSKPGIPSVIAYAMPPVIAIVLFVAYRTLPIRLDRAKE